jgi:hypothetical protein
MYASFSFQRVKITRASVMDDLKSTPFHIKFVSTESAFVYGEACFHLENAPLGIALAKAINDVLATYAVVTPISTEELDARLNAPEPNVEVLPDGSCRPVAPDDDIAF